MNNDLKRRREEKPVSVEDVVALISSLFQDDPSVESINKNTREHEIDGEVLSTMSESEIKSVLQLTFGKARKLHRRAQEIFFQEAPPIQASLLTPSTITNAQASIAPGQLPITPVQPATAPVSAERELEPSIRISIATAPAPASTVTAPAPITTSQTKIDSKTESRVPGLIIKPEKIIKPEPSKPMPSSAPQAPSSHEPSALLAAASRRAKNLISSEEKKVDDQLSAEGSCIGKLHWVTNTKLHQALSQTRGWASEGMESMRLKELVGLGMKCVPPHTTVVVLGNTGTGKSTLLNALLNETNALPTNGMRACTAALAELSYTDEPGYVGEIEFLSEREWETELDGMMSELVQQDGRAILNVDSERPQFASYCKMKAVYGDDYTKSRVRDTSSGATVYKYPMVDDLRADLRRCRSVTRYLGRKEMIRADNVDHFRRKLEWFVDSSNDESSGSPWPLVRMVRMQSSNWKSLKSGTRLVDAPGIRDSNGARDAVVKSYLKTADAIWIVAHIGRAINDKTAKSMLEDSFRRQLLMDGQMSNICFIATQTDSLLHSEVAGLTGSLRLPPTATLQECAAARNAFAKKRIQEDFIDGLDEMMRASGDHSRTRAQLAASYSLPVFCISSVDYMKLVGIKRAEDGPPKVWTDVEGTELPALTRHINEQTLSRRRVIVRQQCDAVLRFCTSIIDFFRDVDSEEMNGDKAKQAREKEMTQKAFKVIAKGLAKDVKLLLSSFDKELKRTFSSVIKPHLQSGAADAASEAEGIVAKWGEPQSSGGMHWSTFAAHLRRHGGPWRLDMNEVMAEPLYKAVSSHWDRAVNSDLTNLLNDFKTKAAHLLASVPTMIFEEKKSQEEVEGGKGKPAVEEDAATKALKRFDALVAGASAAGASAAAAGASSAAAGTSSAAAAAAGTSSSALALIPPPSTSYLPSDDPLFLRLQEIGKRAAGAQVATLQASIDGAKAFASKAQKDINREVPPSIKSQLGSMYDLCNAERGIGSHSRRKGIFGAHVRTHCSTLFTESIDPVLDGLDGLRKSLVGILNQGTERVLRENEISYGMLWEEVKKDGRAIRQRLLAPIETALAEAKNADIALRTAMGDDLSKYKVHDEDGDIEEVEDDAVKSKHEEIEIESDEEDDEDDYSGVAEDKKRPAPAAGKTKTWPTKMARKSAPMPVVADADADDDNDDDDDSGDDNDDSDDEDSEEDN